MREERDAKGGGERRKRIVERINVSSDAYDEAWMCRLFIVEA